jgi:hypothetical protein
MSLLLKRLTNSILKSYSEIESDIIRRLKESEGNVKIEDIETYIEGHDDVRITSAVLSDENGVELHLSDHSTIGLDSLDGLQLLRVYDFIVYA